MNRNVSVEFSIDKENNRIIVKRTFVAAVSDVWAAWTESELLDRWWAPKPWQSKTKSMDFNVGGRRMYAMIGPAGEEHWSLQDFTAIAPIKNLKFQDAFCDEAGNIDHALPLSEWNVDFEASNGTTIVHIDIKLERLSDIEKYIEMGFKEGFIAALENLEGLLKQ